MAFFGQFVHIFANLFYFFQNSFSGLEFSFFGQYLLFLVQIYVNLHRLCPIAAYFVKLKQLMLQLVVTTIVATAGNFTNIIAASSDQNSCYYYL